VLRFAPVAAIELLDEFPGLRAGDRGHHPPLPEISTLLFLVMRCVNASLSKRLRASSGIAFAPQLNSCWLPSLAGLY
jgi:hypothetical protein